jgi:hypothetical protein
VAARYLLALVLVLAAPCASGLAVEVRPAEPLPNGRATPEQPVTYLVEVRSPFADGCGPGARIQLFATSGPGVVTAFDPASGELAADAGDPSQLRFDSHLTVEVARTLAAFKPIAVIVTANVSPCGGQALAAEADLTVVVDYLADGHLQRRGEPATVRAHRDGVVHVEVANLGNGASRAHFRTSTDREGLILHPPPEVLLESPVQGPTDKDRTEVIFRVVAGPRTGTFRATLVAEFGADLVSPSPLATATRALDVSITVEPASVVPAPPMAALGALAMAAVSTGLRRSAIRL